MFSALKKALPDLEPARAHRRARRAAVEVVPLESRSLLSTLTITESVNPQVLWPPNGRRVPVAVSGMITDSGATVNSVMYNIQDSEKGTTTPNMPVMLNGNGQYSFTVDLQARRSGRDKSGRMYTIDILASDTVGTSAMDSAVVIVPHDQGHRGGNNGVLSGAPGQSGRRGTGSGTGASNRLQFGGPGQGQQNTVSVTGNNNTVTQNVTNNQTNTYNINNSFNTTMTSPPATTPSSSGNGGDQGDQGDGNGGGDSGDQGGGNGHGHGNGNGKDHKNGGD